MIRSYDGAEFAAYVAMPAVLPAPAVVMVPAVFGVNDGARAWADRYAERGFICIAPDFFWRTIPGPMDPNVPEELAKSLERTKLFNIDDGVRDLTAARDYALAMPECNGKWSVAGYCFGGRYTLRAGAHLGADALVAFHPTKMGVELEAAAAITCPTSFHFGGADDMTPPADVAAVRAAMADNPLAEIYVYPGVDHAFTMSDQPSYDVEASERSFERAARVLDGLKTRLRIA